MLACGYIHFDDAGRVSQEAIWFRYAISASPTETPRRVAEFRESTPISSTPATHHTPENGQQIISVQY